MDYIPFMLFFIVYFMGFCGNMAKTYDIVPAGVWPAQTHGLDKPADYTSPSPEDLDLPEVKKPLKHKLLNDDDDDDDDDEGNYFCRPSIITPNRLFNIEENSGVPELILQSYIFHQSVTYVECRDEHATCFKDIRISGIENKNCTCETVINRGVLSVQAKGKLIYVPFEIPTDCMCTKPDLNAWKLIN